jgi:hypothetical protein
MVKSIASVASYDVSKSSPTRSTEENTFWKRAQKDECQIQDTSSA